MPSLAASLHDWRRAFKLASLWYNLALEDLRDRYRKTVLGTIWTVLSFALFVAVYILVFGQRVAATKPEFALFVTLGFGLWSYINAVTVDACNAFLHSRAWLLGTAIPYPVFLLQAVLRNCLIFALILVVMALALIWKPTPWSAAAWFAIPGLLAYLLTSVWLAAILAPLCARYRDLQHAIQTGMRLLFFLTPVLWMPGGNRALGALAQWNPVTSFIEIVRAPLLYNRVPLDSWAIVLVINAIGLLLGVIVYAHTRKRVAYWV